MVVDLDRDAMLAGRFYRLDGHEAVTCPVEQWGQEFARKDRTVAKTRSGAVLVSTVFLGMDHGFGGGPPLLFESMIFDDFHARAIDETCERYTTWEQAEAGHAALVRRVRWHHVLHPLRWIRGTLAQRRRDRPPTP